MPTAKDLSIKLQFDRLQRHYEDAVHTYDAVAFLDLSHSLRIWVDLKPELAKHFPRVLSTRSFKTASASKAAMRAAAGGPHVFAYLADPVVSFVPKSVAIGGPIGGFRSISVRASQEPGGGATRFFSMAAVPFGRDHPAYAALEHTTTGRLNFVQWMGAEIVRLGYPAENDQLVVAKLSREMLIKRVANTMNGSHPTPLGPPTFTNVNDAAVKRLLSYWFGEIPLPYLLLLKIAQDIIEHMPTVLQWQKPEASGSV